MNLPRGWGSKIGLALKIGAIVTATASDTGEVAGLPIPSSASITAWAEENGRGLSSAQKQGDMVNAAFDGISTAVADKSNELIDSVFMDAELEVGMSSIPPLRLLFFLIISKHTPLFVIASHVLSLSGKGKRMPSPWEAFETRSRDPTKPRIAPLYNNKRNKLRAITPFRKPILSDWLID